MYYEDVAFDGVLPSMGAPPPQGINYFSCIIDIIAIDIWITVLIATLLCSLTVSNVF